MSRKNPVFRQWRRHTVLNPQWRGFLRANTLNTKPPTRVFERAHVNKNPRPGFLREDKAPKTPRPGFLRANTNPRPGFLRANTLNTKPPRVLRASKAAKTLTRAFESAHDQHQ